MRTHAAVLAICPNNPGLLPCWPCGCCVLAGDCTAVEAGRAIGGATFGREGATVGREGAREPPPKERPPPPDPPPPERGMLLRFLVKGLWKFGFGLDCAGRIRSVVCCSVELEGSCPWAEMK